MIYIYGLYDPKTSQCRYVGKTKMKLNLRLKGHRTCANRFRSHLSSWFKSTTPEIFQIDCVEDKEWQFWERFYIAYFKMIGCNLLNITRGGDCGVENHTQQAREKISMARKGKPLTEEHKEKLRLAKLGKKQSPEHIAKCVESRKRNGKKPSDRVLEVFRQYRENRILTEETRKKMRESHLGKKQSPEAKLNQIKAQTGRKLPTEWVQNCQKGLKKYRETIKIKTCAKCGKEFTTKCNRFCDPCRKHNKEATKKRSNLKEQLKRQAKRTKNV